MTHYKQYHPQRNPDVLVELGRFGRIMLHLRCLFYNHKFRWHLAGIWRELLQAIVVGTAMSWFGIDTNLLAQPFSANTNSLEQRPVAIFRNARESRNSSAESASSSEATLSGPQASLLGACQWLNTPPLLPSDLRGKVVLVNFWTYSCINCLRMLPYVRAWAEKYKD